MQLSHWAMIYFLGSPQGQGDFPRTQIRLKAGRNTPQPAITAHSGDKNLLLSTREKVEAFLILDLDTFLEKILNTRNDYFW